MSKFPNNGALRIIKFAAKYITILHTILQSARRSLTGFWFLKQELYPQEPGDFDLLENPSYGKGSITGSS